jgi:rhodanese-related sulfurtransferase
MFRRGLRHLALIVALVFATAYGLTACSAPCAGCVSSPGPAASSFSALPDASAPAPLPLTVSVGQASALRDGGAFVLDVREPSEWVTGHIHGATLVPLGQLPNRLSEVPRERMVVVVCHSGNRSAQARDLLLAAGYPSVTSISGGMTAWLAAGLPVDTGS